MVNQIRLHQRTAGQKKGLKETSQRFIRVQRLFHLSAFDPENSAGLDGDGCGHTCAMRSGDALLADKTAVALQSKRRFFSIWRRDTDFYSSCLNIENAVCRVALTKDDPSFGHIKNCLARTSCHEVFMKMFFLMC